MLTNFWFNYRQQAWVLKNLLLTESASDLVTGNLSPARSNCLWGILVRWDFGVFSKNEFF